MPSWKRIFLASLGVGAGLGITAAVILGGLAWYRSQPQPWNNAAIKAKFDYVDTEGNDKRIVFHYVLENATSRDYTLDLPAVVIMARLKQQQALSAGNEYLELSTPPFIPAGQRAWVTIQLKSPYKYEGDETLSAGAGREEREKYREAVASWLSKEASNLDGFVIYDAVNRYQIDLPREW